jgi:formylmethanofuran dehydrogenase subunit A
VTDALRIVGGTVYDPSNGVDGAVRDICIEAGRVVEHVAPDARTLDAAGLVVMPGGVDLHSHIAGPAANLARRLEPERRRTRGLAARVVEGRRLRSGTCGTVPSTFATGELYSLLGYTVAFDAAVPLLGARHAHLELGDTPLLDSGFYLLLGNDAFLRDAIENRDAPRAREILAWALGAAGAYGVKVVSPGGVEAWKSRRANPGLDDPIPGRSTTPRRILEMVAEAADALRLPHPMHLHCNNLGVAGNVETTLETMRALDGRRAHLAHLQFHAYAGDPGGRPRSAAARVIEELSRRPNLSADCGQVLFGPAMAMTGDSRVGEMLADLTGSRWVDTDLELEGGCGIVPYEYKDRSHVHAVQFAVGLELLLLSQDPWRLVLSTDHPNGALFTQYPRLIRLLMDRAFRDEALRRLRPEALEGSPLLDGLGREYTLGEIAIITRAGPARLLGLPHKGHLGVGADADIAIYAPSSDAERMFTTPRYVFKGGVLVCEDGAVRSPQGGQTLLAAPAFDRSIEKPLRALVEAEGTVPWEDYRVERDELRLPGGDAS